MYQLSLSGIDFDLERMRSEIIVKDARANISSRKRRLI